MGDSDSDSEHSENNGNKSHSKEDRKVGFSFLLSAALVGLVLPALFGVNGLEILIWMGVAFALFVIGITVLFVAGAMKLFEKKAIPVKDELDSAPASIIIDSEVESTQIAPPENIENSREDPAKIYWGMSLGELIMAILVGLSIYPILYFGW